MLAADSAVPFGADLELDKHGVRVRSGLADAGESGACFDNCSDLAPKGNVAVPKLGKPAFALQDALGPCHDVLVVRVSGESLSTVEGNKGNAKSIELSMCNTLEIAKERAIDGGLKAHGLTRLSSPCRG